MEAFRLERAREFPDIQEKLSSALNIIKDNLEWYNIKGKEIAMWLDKKEQDKKGPKRDKKGPNGGYAVAPLNAILVTIIALIPYFLNHH